MSRVTFITGNQNKADYLARHLDVELDHQKIDLDEIQSKDPVVIAEHKAKQAFKILKKPVLIEDVSLEFVAMDNLPGPFVKFFIESKNGGELLCRMLDNFADRSAVARCVYTYFDGSELKTFNSTCLGNISDTPRGENGYGWDTVFELDGMNGKTNAELDSADYDIFQTSLKPFDELKLFLETK